MKKMARDISAARRAAKARTGGDGTMLGWTAAGNSLRPLVGAVKRALTIGQGDLPMEVRQSANRSKWAVHMPNTPTTGRGFAVAKRDQWSRL
jgi:hypothetical protein